MRAPRTLEDVAKLVALQTSPGAGEIGPDGPVHVVEEIL